MENIKKYWIYFCIAFGISMFVKPALCFIILGSVAVYIGMATILVLRKIYKNGIECTGRILSFEPNDNGSKTPAVQYKAPSGEIITGQPLVYASTELSKFRMYSNLVDTEVRVLCDPGDPKKFVLGNVKASNYSVSLVVILFGLVFLLFGAGNLLGYIKLT